MLECGTSVRTGGNQGLFPRILCEGAVNGSNCRCIVWVLEADPQMGLEVWVFLGEMPGEYKGRDSRSTLRTDSLQTTGQVRHLWRQRGRKDLTGRVWDCSTSLRRFPQLKLPVSGAPPRKEPALASAPIVFLLRGSKRREGSCRRPQGCHSRHWPWCFPQSLSMG